MENNNVLHDHQNGFKKRTHTVTNHVIVMNLARRNKFRLLGGAIDIRKAYDGVCRFKLLKSLAHLRIGQR